MQKRVFLFGLACPQEKWLRKMPNSGVSCGAIVIGQNTGVPPCCGCDRVSGLRFVLGIENRKGGFGQSPKAKGT